MKARPRFRGPRLPALAGDEARRKILQTVQRIPRGSVASYGQVAFEAGLAGRARLVGRVLSELPSELSAAVPGRAQAATASVARKSAAACPWHRVINAQGMVSLPKGSPSHLEQKRRLRDEGVVMRGGRVDLRRFGWRPRSDAPLLD